MQLDALDKADGQPSPRVAGIPRGTVAPAVGRDRLHIGDPGLEGGDGHPNAGGELDGMMLDGGSLEEQGEEGNQAQTVDDLDDGVAQMML